MKFSYNWLNELVEGKALSAKELSDLITMKTAESEGVEAWGEHFRTVVAARVLHVEAVPDSKIVKARVDAGPLGEKTLVCGAPNCREGLLTALATAGTVIEGREIAVATIRGVRSEGMLASGVELGINREHEGILELEEFAEVVGLQPGDPIPGCTPDAIIEIDNKSLTHRPDLWGHYGMAREVAAIAGGTLKDPVDPALVPTGECPFGIEILDGQLAPRYSGLLVENVKVGPSPLWLQNRLSSVGLNPINNVVDITNFVLAELGQPMHAFDAAKLRGNTITIRPAAEGEQCAALNDEVYTLNATNVVIADDAGAIAIAGVIGGRDSAITETTTRVFLESANFNASNIRRTSSSLRLRTDASMRFEKAQDPENTVRGIARALELLLAVCPEARVAGGLGDVYFPLPKPAPIALPHAWLERKLGRAITIAEVRGILESIGFGVEQQGEEALLVEVPSWRATKDVSIKDDLVEEVGRMVGYASIAPQPPLGPAVVPHDNPERRQHHQVRQALTALGYTEIYDYSFVTAKQAAAFGYAPESMVHIANPIAEDLAYMRPSLLPGVLQNCQRNLRNFERFRFFEIGREIRKSASGLPNEVNVLAVCCASKGGEESGRGETNLFELKRIARQLLSGARLEPEAAHHHEHPFRAARIDWQGETVGRLFELHPDLFEGRGAVLYLNLDQALRLQPAAQKYTPLRRYPTSSFDLSVMVDHREHSGVVQDAIRGYAGDRLADVQFVRAYEGAPLPEGRKSLSYRLIVGALDHTLSNDELTAIRQQVIDGLQGEGRELRV
ncbi:MAG: phenylalanine--tRNA ligase subunit beta [Bryobacterales bacterium]|nr:phenylalanine--tRNA ligase subunit beta [Bryobacterales bacterium]